MTFNSIQYFCFLALVILVQLRLGRTGQNRLMAVASAIFYAAFDVRFLALLWVSILVDYSIARNMAATDDRRRRRQLLGISLVVELGILGFFKYADFFSDSAADFLALFGFQADFFTLEVLLPVGISFYTFQSLAYVLAVYKGQVEPERNLVTYAAFVSWFPQLVAGPIERAATLLPQVRARRTAPPAAVVESGVGLIVQGLFKKVVLADSLAGYVGEVYGAPGQHSWLALVTATVGFSVQVYGDFSGYTDIARGSSRLLGVELRRNFEQPFLSRDIREFWTRWHTSLSAWFIDFVAEPLRASRRGPVGSALVILVMFTLIGVWHGAAWTFVLWGFLNGVLVASWRLRSSPKRRHPMKIRAGEIPAITFTFGLFCLGAVFFRAESFGVAMDVLQGIVTLRDGAPGPSTGPLVPIMLALLVAVDLLERRQRVEAIESLRVRARLGTVATLPEAVVESPTRALPAPVIGVLGGLMVASLVVFSGATPTPFVYFQF